MGCRCHSSATWPHAEEQLGLPIQGKPGRLSARRRDNSILKVGAKSNELPDNDRGKNTNFVATLIGPLGEILFLTA